MIQNLCKNSQKKHRIYLSDSVLHNMLILMYCSARPIMHAHRYIVMYICITVQLFRSNEGVLSAHLCTSIMFDLLIDCPLAYHIYH